jgi:hypothetical protein
MNLEQVAVTVGENRKQLRQRLVEARAVLSDHVREGFGKGKFDFERKQLVGENGFVLQWLVRERPDEPVSYENQQTSRGTVVCLKPKK